MLDVKVLNCWIASDEGGLSYIYIYVPSFLQHAILNLFYNIIFHFIYTYTISPSKFQAYSSPNSKRPNHWHLLSYILETP